MMMMFYCYVCVVGPFTPTHFERWVAGLHYFVAFYFLSFNILQSDSKSNSSLSASIESDVESTEDSEATSECGASGSSASRYVARNSPLILQDRHSKPQLIKFLMPPTSPTVMVVRVIALKTASVIVPCSGNEICHMHVVLPRPSTCWM